MRWLAIRCPIKRSLSDKSDKSDKSDESGGLEGALVNISC